MIHERGREAPWPLWAWQRFIAGGLPAEVGLEANSAERLTCGSAQSGVIGLFAVGLLSEVDPTFTFYEAITNSTVSRPTPPQR